MSQLKTDSIVCVFFNIYLSECVWDRSVHTAETNCFELVCLFCKNAKHERLKMLANSVYFWPLMSCLGCVTCKKSLSVCNQPFQFCVNLWFAQILIFWWYVYDWVSNGCISCLHSYNLLLDPKIDQVELNDRSRAIFDRLDFHRIFRLSSTRGNSDWLSRLHRLVSPLQSHSK